jgi:hypothetical protein
LSKTPHFVAAANMNDLSQEASSRLHLVPKRLRVDLNQFLLYDFITIVLFVSIRGFSLRSSMSVTRSTSIQALPRVRDIVLNKSVQRYDAKHR